MRRKLSSKGSIAYASVIILQAVVFITTSEGLRSFLQKSDVSGGLSYFLTLAVSYATSLGTSLLALTIAMHLGLTLVETTTPYRKPILNSYTARLFSVVNWLLFLCLYLATVSISALFSFSTFFRLAVSTESSFDIKLAIQSLTNGDPFAVATGLLAVMLCILPLVGSFLVAMQHRMEIYELHFRSQDMLMELEKANARISDNLLEVHERHRTEVKAVEKIDRSSVPSRVQV